MSTTAATFVEIAKERRWRAFDWQLLLYLLLLVGFGMVMGYSANYQAIGGDGLSQTVKTLIWVGIGLTLFFVAANVDYHWLQTFATPIYLVVLALLFATELVGRNLFGAQMSISVAGIDFQFSEISKVLMIVVLSAFLASRRERIGRLSTIVEPAC
jgi:cell division protein FtsW (lipid II flippase)